MGGIGWLTFAAAFRDLEALRFTETLSGDLGAQVDQDGTATLSLSSPHGDAVTTVTIPAGQSQDVAAVAIGGWADYTEYGAPTGGTDPATLSSVAGAIGYGWLGAKQRSTSVESAGLTLMGVRLYNSMRGLFTAIDPVEGGSPSAYAYPFDPVNQFDLDGKEWWGSRAWNKVTRSKTWNRGVGLGRRAWNRGVGLGRRAWNNRETIVRYAGYASIAVCIVASAGVCGVAAGVAAGLSVANRGYKFARKGDYSAGAIWDVTWRSGADIVAWRLPGIRRAYIPRHQSAYSRRMRAAGRWVGQAASAAWVRFG